jgi:hypothetical protein
MTIQYSIRTCTLFVLDELKQNIYETVTSIEIIEFKHMSDSPFTRLEVCYEQEGDILSICFDGEFF